MHVLTHLQSELAEIRAEWGVLNRTEQIIKSKEGNLKDFLSGLEKKRGAAGYGAVIDNHSGMTNGWMAGAG